ncbi:MAG: ATP-binding protein [Burkholderiales bacterium]
MDKLWHFPRPALAKEFLAVFEAHAANTVSLFAPRRSGKTEFLRYDLAKLAEARHYRVVYVSFWKLPLTPVAALLHEMHGANERRNLTERISDFWSMPVNKLKIAGSLAGAKGEIELNLIDDSAKTQADLYAVLDALIGKLTRKHRVLLLLDEVQELALRSNEVFFKFLRTELDTNKERLCAVMTGSSMSGLARLFGPRAAPFYRFGIEKSLPGFDESFVDHMIDAFRRATGRALQRGAALKVFSTMHREPAFREVVAALTAHPAWTLADALTDYRRRLAADAGFVRTWNELTQMDRALLRLIADGEKSPYAQAALKRLGEMLRQSMPSAHQVQTSLRKLNMKMLVMRDENSKSYTMEDEQFRDWVLAVK